MRMTDAIASYLADMKHEGRIRSAGTERAYYDTLKWHADDAGNRDPRTIGRNDIKTTLKRWPNPNTQRTRRSILISFYRWTVEEGHRKDNPAEQTRTPRAQPTTIYRLNEQECRDLLALDGTQFERWIIHLGLCAGLRRDELRGLRGRHFERHGFVWVSADIAKGGKERWVPIIGDLAPIVQEIQQTVHPHEYVLCGVVTGLAGPSRTRYYREYRDRPMSPSHIYDTVVTAGQRAGIATAIHPHLLRHAFGDHIARLAGLHVAQALMGHADPATTHNYTGSVPLDELATAVQGASFLATPLGDPPKNQSYRYGDSNSGFRTGSTGSNLNENTKDGSL
jgi:site-specific recombinase XerD